jgi:hypothetical protein
MEYHQIMRTGCIVLAVLLAACGGTLKVSGEEDAGADTAEDTSGGDVVEDPVEDVVPDVEPEPVEDVGPEPADDPVPDPSVDPVPDPVVDTPADTGPGGMTGDACTDSSECTGVPSDTRFCMNVMWGFVPFPGGYCTAWCGSDSECGTGAGCAVGQCFRECTHDSECRTSEGYVCREIPWVTTQTYCIPPPW